MSVLNNVVVNWASIQDPNIQFEPAWELQVVNLTPEQAKQIIDDSKTAHPKGVKLKTEEDGSLSYRFKRRVARADGNGENPKPVVYGPKGKAGGELTCKIGNGSLCNVQYLFNAYDNKFGKGATCDLKGLQVLILVPYGVEDGGEFGDVDTGAPASTANDDYNEGDF